MSLITHTDLATAAAMIEGYKDYQLIEGSDYMYLMDVDGVWITTFDEEKLALVTSDTWMK